MKGENFYSIPGLMSELRKIPDFEMLSEHMPANTYLTSLLRTSYESGKISEFPISIETLREELMRRAEQSQKEIDYWDKAERGLIRGPSSETISICGKQSKKNKYVNVKALQILDKYVDYTIEKQNREGEL